MKLIKLNPKNASAVIIHFKKKVLLQKRDNIKHIFYPNFWGLFGGAKNKNEKYKSAASREIIEELNYEIDKKKIKYFFKMEKEFPLPKKRSTVKRFFYIYEIKNIGLFHQNAILKEGSKMKFFEKKSLNNIRIAPYDRFALDLFYDLYLK